MKYNTIYFIIKDNVWFDFIGNLKEVYKNRFSLAQYFQGRGDKWLSDQFFQTCLDVSSQEQGGEQRGTVLTSVLYPKNKLLLLSIVYLGFDKFPYPV